MKRILYITDFAMEGSGYHAIAAPLLTLMSKDYDIRVVGLRYDGREHNYPFSIVPCRDESDTFATVHNLCVMPNTEPDVIIVAIDIPYQISFFDKLSRYKKPYIIITPLENGPLTVTWTAQLFPMDWVFFISELGKQEALKSGLSKVDHLEVGIDTNLWRVPTPDEKQNIRKTMGFESDEFVILTVAANQERKNLWAALKITSRLKELGHKVKHVIVTTIDTPYGYKLRDFTQEMNIVQEVVLMNKGMAPENLWSLYALSDAFLLTSKAEGLGLPIMEAMACGVPVVATDTGAIHELLDDHRGFLIPHEYEFRDVWGNSVRHMIDIEKAVAVIEQIISSYWLPIKARALMESKTWDIPARQLSDKIEELTNAKE